MEHSATATSDTTFDTIETTKPSRAVIRTVADAEGVDPTELAPLYTVIDPDKLDTLFQPKATSPGEGTTVGEVRFSYEGYEVRVTASGRVRIEDD